LLLFAFLPKSLIIALAIFEILDQYPLFGFCSALGVRTRAMGVNLEALIEMPRRMNFALASANPLSLCRNRADFNVIQVDLIISGPKSAIVTNERFI
jgi:hypothetical protein